MTLFRHALAAAPLVLLLGLAACGKPAEDSVAPAAEPAAVTPTPTPVPAAAPAAEAPAISLTAEGLRLVAATGATRPLDFGLDKAATVEILNRVQGAAGKESTNAECGAGPIAFVEWPDGLSALFQDGRFVGWSLGNDAAKTLTTMSGVGIGSTRTELTAAYGGATIAETTLGQEFDAGGLYGILSGPGAEAKIEAMWAGTSCVFR